MVEIYLTDEPRKMGPLPIVREFFKNYTPDEDGRITDRDVVIQWDASRFNVANIELKFHSNAIERDFRVRVPRETMDSDDWPSIGALGGKAGEVGRLIEASINSVRREVGEAQFEFVGVMAGSHGYEYLTDYEFDYEMIETSSQIKKADVEEGIKVVESEGTL